MNLIEKNGHFYGFDEKTGLCYDLVTFEVEKDEPEIEAEEVKIEVKTASRKKEKRSK